MWTNGTQWRGTSVGIGCAMQVPHTISTSIEAVRVPLQRAAGLKVACAVHGVTFHGAEMVVRDEHAWFIPVPLTPIMRVARLARPTPQPAWRPTLDSTILLRCPGPRTIWRARWRRFEGRSGVSDASARFSSARLREETSTRAATWT